MRGLGECVYMDGVADGRAEGRVEGRVEGRETGLVDAFDIIDYIEANPLDTDNVIAKHFNCDESIVKKARLRARIPVKM